LRLCRSEPSDPSLQGKAWGDARPVLPTGRLTATSFKTSSPTIATYPTMIKSAWQEFREGVIDIVPVLVAALPIGLLWGTLAVGKGMTPFEAGLTSLSVFAGAAQYVAIDLWRDPAPWLLLTMTVFIVNVRHVLMGASLGRHMDAIP